MTPLFDNLEVVCMGGKELATRSYKSLPPLMRISQKSLAAIYPHDLADFGQRHRRMITIDKETVEYFRSGQYKSPEAREGFLYGYTFESHILAGHYVEDHVKKFLFFDMKHWETNHYFPKIKIGSSSLEDGEVAQTIIKQLYPKRGFAEPPILLFLMHSPDVVSEEGRGLERSTHAVLKSKGYWLKDETIAERPIDLGDEYGADSDLYADLSRGEEWFQCPFSEAYQVAYDCNAQLCKERVAQMA